jgi:hypothetical protein
MFHYWFGEDDMAETTCFYVSTDLLERVFAYTTMPADMKNSLSRRERSAYETDVRQFHRITSIPRQNGGAARYKAVHKKNIK